MATATETPARDAKLIQYLNEAYGKERELEEALRAHISMTTRDAYKKRLQDHLKETTAQAKGLERRIKALGGKAERSELPGPDAVGAAASVASKAVALAKGPLHMLRGTGEAEKLLKNAKTELWNEFEEIGNYIAIEELASSLGDKETEKLAREFRKQEERMANFLQKLIPQLTKQVVKDEIPAAERKQANGGSRRSSAASSRSASRSSSNGGSSSGSSRSSGSTTKRASSSSSRSTSSRAKSGTAGKSRSTGGTSRSRSTGSTSRAKASSKKS